MKNFAQFLVAMRSIAIIALVAVIGFSMAGCKNDDDGDDNGGDGNTEQWWAGTWTQKETISGGTPTANNNTLRLTMVGNITDNWNLSIKRQNNSTWTASGSMWGVTQNSQALGGGRALWIITTQNTRYDLRFETISGTKVKFTTVSSNDTDAQLLLGVWEK